MLQALNNNPLLYLALMLLASGIVFYAKGRRLRAEWAEFQAWRAAGSPGPQTSPQTTKDGPGAAAPGRVVLDPTPLPGAGHALTSPPPTLDALVEATSSHNDATPTVNGGRYRFPLGWITTGIVSASFVEDVNHILISGQNNAGKDNAAAGMLLTLAATHTPRQVQFCIVDGKGLDWRPWEGKAHTWRLACEPSEIRPTMEAISKERERRGRILGAAGVVKWDEYQGGDLPLLVVFISELSLLEDATKAADLAAWLNTELSAGRAFGLRYIVATQNASNFPTRWRSQIGLFLAGFQNSRSADEPNTSMTTNEIEQAGGVPPSKLPAAGGVFTAIHERQAVTLRASLLSGQHRKWELSKLPNKPANTLHTPATATAPGPAKTAASADLAMLHGLLQTGKPLPLENEPVAPATNSAIAHYSGANTQSVAPRSDSAPPSVTLALEALPVAPELVPADEQRRILAAATEARSRRAVCQRLYEVTGGQKYQWVQQVCDAAGLLQAGGTA